MKIAIIGTGYVGLVTGTCLADVGNEVWCVDKNELKLQKLRDGIIPIYEPGLEPLVLNNSRGKRLRFTNNLKEALRQADICFLTVDTPSGKSGAPDLTNVFSAAEQIGDFLEHPMLVVTKSTVPVGTTFKVKALIQKKLEGRGKQADWVAVASNPEFLKEGTSVDDFRVPDRVVVGAESGAQAELLRELYKPFLRDEESFLVTDVASAEICKYAANAMLAVRISFMNEMAGLCERVGGNIDSVRKAVGSDPRIGSRFLLSGLGYGGSCLPKDVSALIQLGKEKDLPLPIVEGAEATNKNQREYFLQKIIRYFGGFENVRGKTLALWGLSFKPETDDIRQAPSVFLIQEFLRLGAAIKAFDPVATDNVRQQFGDQIGFSADMYDCLQGADALVIATEWDLFKNPDFSKVKDFMKKPAIFDGRNLFNPRTMADLGFDYCSIGR